MSNISFIIGLVLVIIGLNFHIINKGLYYFGIFGAFTVCAFGFLVLCKTQMQRQVSIACIIVLLMFMTGEIIGNYGIENKLFNTTDYNFVFWIQLIYVLMISSLIGIYYERKIKEYRH